MYLLFEPLSPGQRYGAERFLSATKAGAGSLTSILLKGEDTSPLGTLPNGNASTGRLRGFLVGVDLVQNGRLGSARTVRVGPTA